jgi:hypothetical protein
MTESKFYAAFRQAQSEFRDPVKDGSNPHFKSRFVTLKGVLDAVRQILHRNGLCVFQCFETMENGQAVIRTELRADDGSGIASCVPVICAKQNDPQAFGSAATYARRYGITAICGIAPADEDDDGEEAARPARAAQKPAAMKAASEMFLAEEAVAQIEAAKSKEALLAVGKRIAARRFTGEDDKRVQAAWVARITQLTPTPTTRI